MVTGKVIHDQIKALDDNLPFWVGPEIRELPQIIIEGETIKHATSGRYQGGIALLIATDQRILVIDKKPLFLAVEDMRYDMIAEINYSHRLLESMFHVNSFNKDLWFSSWRKQQLRALTLYIQQRLSDIRQQREQGEGFEEVQQSSFAPTATPQPQVGLTVPQTAKAREDSKFSDDQARALLPASSRVWGQVSQNLYVNNTYNNNPILMRRRVSKFGLPKVTGQY